MSDTEAKETSRLLPESPRVVHTQHVGEAAAAAAASRRESPPDLPGDEVSPFLPQSSQPSKQMHRMPPPQSAPNGEHQGPLILSTEYGSYEKEESVSKHQQQLLASDRSMMESSTSNMQTLMHLIKGNLGTGILALPKAFSYAGLWLGFGGMLFMGTIAVHCMHMLVRSSHKLCKRTGSMSLDYADVIEVALKTGPPRLRRFAQAGKNVVNGFLIFTQFGFCCVYIVFIAKNVKGVVHHFHDDDPSIVVYEAIVAALLIPYVCVRNLSMLAPFSAFANILTGFGMVIIFQYIVQGLPPVSSRPAAASASDLPMFFGTAIFAVEGISLVLPLENNMKKPEEFGGWTGVLNLGMVFVIAMYTAIGFYGFLQFGDEAEGSITLNLPESTWLYLSVKLMFAVSIYISYNIQFYVAIKIIWPKTRRFFSSRAAHRKGEYVFRIGLVVFTFAIAVLIPHLDLLISLIGASASTALALIMPVFIELLTMAGESEDDNDYPGLMVSMDRDVRGFSSLPKTVLVKNILILVFAVIGWVLGTYTSVKAVVEAF